MLRHAGRWVARTNIKKSSTSFRWENHKSTGDKEKLQTDSECKKIRYGLCGFTSKSNPTTQNLRKGLTFGIISVYIVQLKIWQIHSPFTCSSLHMQQNLCLLLKFYTSSVKLRRLIALLFIRRSHRWCKLLLLLVPKFLESYLNSVVFRITLLRL